MMTIVLRVNVVYMYPEIFEQEEVKIMFNSKVFVGNLKS